MYPVLKIMHMLNFLDTFSMGITPGGAKTAIVAKLRGGFVVFFLRGPKSQLWKN